MQATETLEELKDDDDDIHILTGKEKPRFFVEVKHTDVDGTDYLKIEAHRTFNSPGEVNAWLSSCVARLTAELVNLSEADHA